MGLNSYAHYALWICVIVELTALIVSSSEMVVIIVVGSTNEVLIDSLWKEKSTVLFTSKTSCVFCSTSVLYCQRELSISSPCQLLCTWHTNRIILGSDKYWL